MFILKDYYKVPKQLLSIGTTNVKTKKSLAYGYHTLILYLSPASQNSEGKNLCPASTEGCRAACLFTAGRGIFTSTQSARLNRTQYFLKNRKGFMEQMVKEIKKEYKKYGDTLCIRLNGTSDIAWENIPVDGAKNIFEKFNKIIFYGYTKVFNRLLQPQPKNHHLTFSYAETEINHMYSMMALELGYSVAMVFGTTNPDNFPKTYKGVPVVNGDLHDLTFLAPKGSIIALKMKGDAKKDTTGFVVRDF